jgi:hypothetical protein
VPRRQCALRVVLATYRRGSSAGIRPRRAAGDRLSRRPIVSRPAAPVNAKVRGWPHEPPAVKHRVCLDLPVHASRGAAPA